MNRKKPHKDPHFTREADKYEHPVPSREYILATMEQRAEQMTLDDLIAAFALKKHLHEGLHRRIRAMCRERQLVWVKRKFYKIAAEEEKLTGIVRGLRDGSGLVVIHNGGGDVSLNQQQMLELFPDDEVTVRVRGLDRRGVRYGDLLDIVKRNTTSVAGKAEKKRGNFILRVQARKFKYEVELENKNNIEFYEGDYLQAEITKMPNDKYLALANVEKNLGTDLTAGMEVELAIRSHNLPYEWSEEITSEVAALPDAVLKQDLKGRKDLRGLAFVTIDGEDSKDFDDAVYCEKIQDGYKLLVAIADVGHYVKVGSAIDQEAILRGNSVYFPMHVLPMLPEKLSNNLCSLKPKVDRLAYVCSMRLDDNGTLTNFEFYPAVIHSHARLTYKQVAKYFGEKVNCKKPSPPENTHQSLNSYAKLFAKLLELRQERGAIDFDTTETRIVFDENAKISDVVPVHRLSSHRMIEEAMLLANVCAAEHAEKNELEVPFRNHPPPDATRLADARKFISCFGLRLEGGATPAAKDYSKVLGQLKGRKESRLLQTVLLRSLQQATYATENIGHFGLSFAAYAHFTSPIRRYPDLLLHRALRSKKTRQPVADLSVNCSFTERRADLATRDAHDWLKCHFMQKKVGEMFPATVIEVTKFGMFVEIERWGIQGLLHISELGKDFYIFEPENYQLVAKGKSKRYRIGDQLKIQVAKVDLDERLIDFALVEE
jgi:ribonuclease R